jgi:MFS family permease
MPALVFEIIFHRVFGRWAEREKKERKETYGYGEASSTSGRLRRLVAFLVLSTSTQAVTLSTIPFVPLFMVDHFGVSKEIAAASVAIIYSAELWSGPLAGYLSDRLGSVPVVIVVCFVSGPLVYLQNLVPYGIGFSALLLAIGMTFIMRSVVSQACVVGQTSERRRSTILGIYFFFGREGSGILTPVMGYFIDHLGFSYGFTIAGAALVTLTIACSIFLMGSRE